MVSRSRPVLSTTSLIETKANIIQTGGFPFGHHNYLTFIICTSDCSKITIWFVSDVKKKSIM